MYGGAGRGEIMRVSAYSQPFNLDRDTDVGKDMQLSTPAHRSLAALPESDGRTRHDPNGPRFPVDDG